MDLVGALNKFGPIALKLMYGDGIDGALNYSVTSTLSRDMYATTIDCSADTATAGFRLFATKRITIANGGVINNNGGAGGAASNQTGGTAGAAAPRGSCGLFPISGFSGGSVSSISGGDGGGNASIRCDVSTNDSGQGGAGGQGKNSCPGGTDAGVPGNAGLKNQEGFRPYRQFHYIHDWFGSESYPYTGMPGGSGGGGSGRLVAGRPTGGGGGGSGAAGGMVFLCAPLIDIQSGAIVRAKGGNGGSGANANAGSFGGGGGAGAAGSGGTIVLIYEKLIADGTIEVPPGSTNGTAGNGDNCGGNGGGVTVPFFQEGRILKINWMAMSITATS